jgi:hypothetical protein
VTRHAFEFKGVDESLGGHDLAVLAAEAILIALWIALDEAPRAARSDIHCVDCGRHSPWSHPMRNVIWVRVRLEHKLARRIEDARHPDLAI